MSDPTRDNSGAIGNNSSRYKDWSAILDLQSVVGKTPLRVRGKYHLNQRCGGVTLEATIPVGINPTILLLDLVDGPGDGGDSVDVEAEFPAEQGQYSSVTVTDSDGESVSVEVQEVH